MALGSWEVKVAVDAMPQKVATAVGELADQLIGAEYTPIAYLGSQVVNGINHAVLAEQTIITGKDTKNVVILIFNEKPNEMKATLVNIERVIEQGGELGGIHVDVQTNIPAEAKESFDKAFEGFVGSKVEPFAYLGSQVTKDVDYIFAAKVTSVTAEPVTKVCLVTVNGMSGDIAFGDLLDSRNDLMTVGYAFTWLKKGTSFGAPLGEWP